MLHNQSRVFRKETLLFWYRSSILLRHRPFFLSARILINCCKGGFILRSMKACLFPPISYPSLGHMWAEMCLCYTLPKTMHSSQYGVLALLCQDVSFTSSSEQCTSNCQCPWESILEDKFSGVLKPQFLWNLTHILVCTFMSVLDGYIIKTPKGTSTDLWTNTQKIKATLIGKKLFPFVKLSGGLCGFITEENHVLSSGICQT